MTVNVINSSKINSIIVVETFPINANSLAPSIRATNPDLTGFAKLHNRNVKTLQHLNFD